MSIIAAAMANLKAPSPVRPALECEDRTVQFTKYKTAVLGADSDV